jgi:hypothetical protein
MAGTSLLWSITREFIIFAMVGLPDLDNVVAYVQGLKK